MGQSRGKGSTFNYDGLNKAMANNRVRKKAVQMSCLLLFDNHHSQKMLQKLDSENCIIIRDSYCYKVFS